jgi:hypothetical protein
MSVMHEAYKAIRVWQSRHKNALEDSTDWAARNLAGDLAQAGLLAEDLPERPDDGIWGGVGEFLVDTSNNGDVAILPPHPGVVFITPQESRETAYSLLAAANHAEEEA